MTRTALVVSVALLGLGVFLLGELFPRARRPYSTDLGALQARFNDDAGKVRLLLLLSPT
jgi:hypothetical protein